MDISQFLKQIHTVPVDVLTEYISHWEDYQASRKTILTSPGETQRYMYFVKQGIQKSYYLSEGKQHIMAFTYPPSFSGIPESFFTQKPSHYFLETLTDSAFIRLSYDKHQELMESHREIETLFRKGTEQLLAGVITRQFELMALSIEDRFRAFASRSPHLFQMVSHKDLASYLRIDPTNFSKLYNRIQI
jgi:CRP-like cAMP-binding protein